MKLIMETFFRSTCIVSYRNRLDAIMDGLLVAECSLGRVLHCSISKNAQLISCISISSSKKR